MVCSDWVLTLIVFYILTRLNTLLHRPFYLSMFIFQHTPLPVLLTSPYVAHEHIKPHMKHTHTRQTLREGDIKMCHRSDIKHRQASTKYLTSTSRSPPPRLMHGAGRQVTGTQPRPAMNNLCLKCVGTRRAGQQATRPAREHRVISFRPPLHLPVTRR